MALVVAGRQTARIDGEFVVFLIGMRVNRWSAVRHWLPAFLAMPRMLAELAKDPDSGLLGTRTTLSSDGPLLVQYWRSVDQLNAYAADAASAHRPAWRAFNARARRSGGTVGVWHETYVVPAGSYETIYVDMPRVGLAQAAQVGPVAAASRAADRLPVRASGRA